jgi:hypothetical protein
VKLNRKKSAGTDETFHPVERFVVKNSHRNHEGWNGKNQFTGLFGREFSRTQGHLKAQGVSTLLGGPAHILDPHQPANFHSKHVILKASKL